MPHTFALGTPRKKFSCVRAQGPQYFGWRTRVWAPTGLTQRQPAVWFETQDFYGKYYASEGVRGIFAGPDRGETPSRLGPGSAPLTTQGVLARPEEAST
jgi:hypothetical protein